MQKREAEKEEAQTIKEGEWGQAINNTKGNKGGDNGSAPAAATSDDSASGVGGGTADK